VSAADDARDHLTVAVWEVLRKYTHAPRVEHVDMIHAAAERYGHALAEEHEGDAIKKLRLETVTAEYWKTA